MKNILNEMINMEIENALNSRVIGRRNWVIRVQNTEDNERYICYAGGFGQANRYGYLSERLSFIAERKVRWYEFTYKKDFLSALEELKKLGYK